MQTLDFAFLEALAQLDGREPRSVQDFVRIGVSDPTKQVWIREGSLEGVVLAHAEAFSILRDQVGRPVMAGCMRTRVSMTSRREVRSWASSHQEITAV
jgi:hypothetical protein